MPTNDPILREMLAEQSYGSLYSANFRDAASAAKANETARRLGMAPDLVEAALPDMLAEDRLRKRAQEAKRNPAYARVMANPRLAAAAMDDDELPKVAQRTDELASYGWGPYANLRRAGHVLGAGAVNFFGGLLGATSRGVAGIGQMLRENMPATLMSQPSLGAMTLALGQGSRILQPAARGLDEGTTITTGNRNVDDVLMGVRSAGSSVAALGITVATRNPWLGAGALGAVTGGTSYEEAREEGLDPTSAGAYAFGDALVETGTEIIGQKIFGNAVREGRSILKAIGFDIAAEVPGEISATALQELNKWFWIERPKGKPFDEYLRELPDEIRSTVVATITTAGFLGTVGIPIGKAIDRRVDQVTAERVDAVMQAAAASPTRTANPSDFEEALNQLVGDTASENLYIPAEQVEALFQTDSLQEDGFWGQYAAEVEEASALGGDVVIPLAKAATHLAGTPQWEQLREHVRTRPGGSSVSEAKQRQTPEELEAIAAALGERLSRSVPKLQADRMVKKFATDLGYQGAQADKVGGFLSAALTRAHAVENAKRVARGEGEQSLEEFASGWLPSATKMAQAQYNERDALSQITPQQALETNVALDLPADPLFGEAVANTDAATLTDDGLLIDVVRVQKPEQEGASAIRTGVFYLPKGSPNLRHYKTGGQPGKWYGGTEKFEGQTLIRRPLFVKGATGGKAPEAAYDAIKGKGAFKKFEREVIAAAVNPALSRDPSLMEENVSNFLEENGVEGWRAYDVIRLSNKGNQLRYALQELVIAHVVREAGYDAVVGWSKGKKGASISEVFDVREQSYPARGMESLVHEDFEPAFSQALNDSARGNISIQRDESGIMSGAIIRAFESADFSTAIHELGHFFLEDLRRRALRGDATDQEKADWETFKAWAKELGHEVSDTKLIPVPAHEYFARGMERYVWEGKAPSANLRPLFSRMREFMLKLYRAVSSFNAPISPEVREVMDRMLASEEEIEQQRREMALASGNLAELMSESEREAYANLASEAREDARDNLFASILSTLKLERSKEWKATRDAIRAEVQDEVDGLPIYQALRILRSGIKQDDGTTARVRLSRQWIVDSYGEEALAQLPKGVPPIVADTDTMDADQIADMAGFGSSDEMIRAMMDHETARQALAESGDKRSPRAKAIDDGTDNRVREEIGDPYANLEEEAQGVLASERQADLMSMELRALARKSGKRPTAWKMAKEWARTRVRSQTSKEAISGNALQMYARNAAKAGQNAEEALIKGDFGEAFRFKQQQLLNLALLSEAKAAKDEVDKAVRRMERTASRATIPSVDQDYLDQAHQLLEQVDMKTRPQTRVDKRLAFEAWYQRQVDMGIEPIVPPEYRAIIGMTHWSRLPVDELLELDAAVSQVIELGRLKKQLIDGKKRRDFDEAVFELQAKAEEQRTRKQTADNDPNRTLGGRIKSRICGLDAAMLKIEQMADWLDGGDPTGPWNRLLFAPMAEAQGRENDLMRTYVERINGLITGLPKALVRSWDRKVDTPELRINVAGHPQRGQPFQFTKDQIVMMAMNWGNAGNRQRLLDGFGWEEADVIQVFDRLMGKEDWDFVQNVWDTIDGLWPEIEALERRVNGVAPEKVEAVQVATKHGVYKGGYFPAVYDPTYSSRVELDEASKLAPNGAWHQVTTRSGSTHARAQAVKGRPLLLNMGVITRHIGEVIHDVTHREAVNQTRKILSDARVRTAVSAHLGPEYLKRMESWVENIATPNASNAKSDPTMVALARHLNKGVSLVGLGFRLSTILVQPLGLANMTASLGEAAMLNGLRLFTAHPIQTYNEVSSRSAEMRARFSTMDASLEEMAKDAASGKLQKIGPRGITKYAFHGILYVDLAMTTAGWIGAFNKGLSQGMNEEEAGYYADKIIRTTQGSGGNKDRSAILYENQFARTFWPFFSYLNALYNQQRDIMRRGRNVESAGQGLDVMRRAWWVMIVPPLLQALLLGQGPDDDGDDPESWAWYLTKAVMLGNFASIPGVGPVANAIGSGYGYRSNAWQGIGEGIKKGWEDLDKVVTEGEALKGSTIKSVMTTIGILSAKPLGQIGATSQGLYDYARGDANPEDAGDWYDLLTRGRVED